LAGERGIVRIATEGGVERVVSGYGIVGIAFTQHQSMVVATNTSLIELPVGIKGKPLLEAISKPSVRRS